jgi:hypothetical protein
LLDYCSGEHEESLRVEQVGKMKQIMIVTNLYPSLLKFLKLSLMIGFQYSAAAGIFISSARMTLTLLNHLPKLSMNFSHVEWIGL